MARGFGFATSGCRAAASHGGPRPPTAMPSVWPLTNWPCCSRPATRRARVRLPTGVPWALNLTLRQTALACWRKPCSISLHAKIAGRAKGRGRPTLLAGCHRMRKAPEIVEVDSTQLEKVLRRVEQALDEKDSQLI